MTKSEVLVLGHSWVKYLFAAKKIARENDVQFDSQWWPNANLETIIKNVEMFRPIKAYHKNLLIFCLIPETWRYETLDNTEPIYDSNGLPINPYQILMPNTDFVVSEFVEKFSKFRNYCYKVNPNINVLLMSPPRLDIYQFNLELISKFPQSHQEIFHENPKYSANSMAEHSRNIYGKILELCTYNHGWPERSIFRNQIVAQKVKGCRKIFSKFMKQDVHTLGKEGPFIDGIHPSEDLIKIFWSQVKAWLILSPPIKSIADLPPKKYQASAALPYPEIDPSNQDSPLASEECSEMESADLAKKDICPEPMKILLLGDSWVKYIYDEKNIANENGFELDSKWWPNAKLETIMESVDDCVKPYHKHLLIFCLMSETWRYEFLDDLTGSLAFTSDQEQNHDVSPGFPPNSINQVIMPNPDFSISEFIDKFNKVRQYCLKLNPNLNVVLMIPPVIDAYQYNLELISNYPESVQDIFHKNPKYGAPQMADHSRSLNGKLSAMCRRWPTSCFIRSSVVCEKVPAAKNIYMKFRRMKLDTCGKDGPLVDGLNPTIDVIKSFWNIMKVWLEVNENSSMTDEPLEDGQMKTLMIGDESVTGLDFGQHFGMSLPIIHYISHGNLDQMIKLADTYLNYKVDVLFLAPFNWEFLYLTSYVPYEEEPKVPLINENIDMAKILETVKIATENWQQTFPKLKIIWGFPCPINFQKYYEFKVAEYGLPWSPTPEMEFEILYITKAFYALILQLEKEWSQNLPQVNYIDIRKCLFAEESNLEYTFCDNNEPKFPKNCLMENGFVPSKSVSQWFKLNLIDKIEEIEKEHELASLREKRKKERQKFLFRRYLKKKEILDFLNKDIVKEGEQSNKQPVTNVNTKVVANVKQFPASDTSTAAKELVQSAAPNPYEAKKERRRRRRERIKAAKLQEAAAKIEITIGDKSQLDNANDVEPAIPRLMDIPINLQIAQESNHPERQIKSHLDSKSLSLLEPVSSSMLNTLGETLCYMKTIPVVRVTEKEKLSKDENFVWTKLAKEEFSEVSPFRILDIKESPYSYQLSLFFQRGRWEDIFLKGNKAVAMDVILSAIKAMLMLKNEPGVKIIMITTSMPFIKEIEHHLNPVVDKKLVGVNGSLSLSTPSVLIDTPSNLNQKFMDPNRKWDISDISALIVFGDDLINKRHSPVTLKFPHVVNQIYSYVQPEHVNKVVISENGGDESEKSACQILRTKLSRKQDAVCPPPEDKSLSLFELLACELDKDVILKNNEGNGQTNSLIEKFQKKLGLDGKSQPPLKNQFTPENESSDYARNLGANDPGSGSLAKASTSKEEAAFAIFLKSHGPTIEKEYMESGKNIVLSHERHYMNFLNNPSLHQDYASLRGKFKKDFQKNSGPKYNWSELESSWIVFWRDYISDLKGIELKKKLNILQEDFRKKYPMNQSYIDNMSAENHSINTEASRNDKNVVESHNNANKIEIAKTKDSSNLKENNIINQKENLMESNDNNANSTPNVANVEKDAIQVAAKAAFEKLFKSWDKKKTSSDDEPLQKEVEGIKDNSSDKICNLDVDVGVPVDNIIAGDTLSVQSGGSAAVKSQVDKLPESLSDKNNVDVENIKDISELTVNAQGSIDTSEDLAISDAYLKQLLLREYPKKVEADAAVKKWPESVAARPAKDFNQRSELTAANASYPAEHDSFDSILNSQFNYNYNERTNSHNVPLATQQGYKPRAQSGWDGKSPIETAPTVKPGFKPRGQSGWDGKSPLETVPTVKPGFKPRGQSGWDGKSPLEISPTVKQGFKSRAQSGWDGKSPLESAPTVEPGFNPRGQTSRGRRGARRGRNKTRNDNPREEFWSDQDNPNTVPLGSNANRFRPNPKEAKIFDYGHKNATQNPFIGSDETSLLKSNNNRDKPGISTRWSDKGNANNVPLGLNAKPVINTRWSDKGNANNVPLGLNAKKFKPNPNDTKVSDYGHNTSNNSWFGSEEMSLLQNNQELPNPRRNSSQSENSSSMLSKEVVLRPKRGNQDRVDSEGMFSPNKPEVIDLRNNLSKKSKPNPIEAPSYNPRAAKSFGRKEEMNKQEFYDSLKKNRPSVVEQDLHPLTPKEYGAGRETLLPKNRQQFYDSIKNTPSTLNKETLEHDLNSNLGPRLQYGQGEPRSQMDRLDSRKNRFSNTNQRAGNEHDSNQSPQNQYGQSRERLLPKNRQEFYDSIKGAQSDPNKRMPVGRDFNNEPSDQFGQNRKIPLHKNRQEFYDSMKNTPAKSNKRSLDEDYNAKRPTQGGTEMPLHKSRQEFYDSMKNMSTKGIQHKADLGNKNQFENRPQRAFNNKKPADNYVKGRGNDTVLLENTLNLLDPICDAIGMIGPSLRLIITHAKSCLPDIKATLKVFTEEESVALLNFAITKMRTLAVGPDTNRYMKMIKESTELLEKAKASLISIPTGGSEAKTNFSVDVKLIAKATNGKDKQHIYQFIKNTFLYKGLPEPSPNELDDVFHAVKRIHLA